jgi:hypothetical protein
MKGKSTAKSKYLSPPKAVKTLQIVCFEGLIQLKKSE